jgi:hypothetical protein
VAERFSAATCSLTIGGGTFAQYLPVRGVRRQMFPSFLADGMTCEWSGGVERFWNRQDQHSYHELRSPQAMKIGTAKIAKKVLLSE